MSVELLRVWVGATVASSLALLVIGLIRRPLRIGVGARAACWAWILVPALTLASQLPAPRSAALLVARSLPNPVQATLTRVSTSAWISAGSSIAVWATLSVWLLGTCALFVLLMRRQRSFIRSLGDVRMDERGHLRSGTATAPMLVGLWKSRIIVPEDFDARFSEPERELMLAHERAHQTRHDLLCNAIAYACLCLFWFNPAMYWAVRWFRVDQELACDALVLSRHDAHRQRYAQTLLKSQLLAESGWRMPVGCHLQSAHPLQERITMLQRPLPSRSRQLVGITMIASLALVGSYAAWAQQAAALGVGPQVLITIQATVSESSSGSTTVQSTQYLARSGELPVGMMNARPLAFGCTPYLPGEPATAAALNGPTLHGVPAPKTGQILLRCAVRYDGALVASPTLIAADGQLATVVVSDRTRRYELQINASEPLNATGSARRPAPGAGHG